MTTLMEIKLNWNDVGPCQKELKVEVPVETVEAELEAVYQGLKQRARVPGFRVGFAPRDLLETYHGDTAREEVIRRLIRRSLQEGLSSQPNLDLVGRPQVSQVHFVPREPFVFLAKIEVAPTVPLGRYKRLPLTKKKITISEEAIQEALKHLQEIHAELKPVLQPRVAQEGDFLLVDLIEEQPSPPAGQAGKAPVKRRDLLIHLDLKKDEEGFLKSLIGMNPGEKREHTLKGLKVTVDLKGLKVKELSPLEDAFAKNVGPFETLSALKEAIREDLKKQEGLVQRRDLQGQAVQQLLEGWSFDVPPSLVASQARRILKGRALELISQGVAPEEVEERAKLLTEQAKLDAFKEVKLFFILRRIAAAEGLTASQEELQGKIQALANRFGRSPDETRQDLEEKDLLEEMAWGIVREKVFDLILKEADS